MISESRRKTLVEYKNVDSNQPLDLSWVSETSLESDCLLTWLMISTAKLFSISSWGCSMGVMIHSGTCRREESFHIFISAPFQISKNDLLFSGWRTKDSFVFFVVAKERQEWKNSFEFKFHFLPQVGAHSWFVTWIHHVACLSFYHHMLLWIFCLHETCSKVVSIIYKGWVKTEITWDSCQPHRSIPQTPGL